MTRLALVVSVMVMLGCSAGGGIDMRGCTHTPEYEGVDDDTIEEAVLHKFYGMIGAGTDDMDIKLGDGQGQIDATARDLDAARAWGAAQPDCRVRAAADHWVAYYERRLAKARAEFAYRSTRKPAPAL